MRHQNSTGKRIGLWLGIMICITAFGLTACGGGDEEEMETPTAIVEATAVVEPTATEAPAPTEAPAASEAPAAEEAAAEEEATVEERAPLTETTTLTETSSVTETGVLTETGAADAPAATAGAAQGDVAAVAAIVTKGTCNACHVIPGIEGAIGIVGPDLSNIGVVAATRIEGYTAEEYLRESIMDPNAFIAPECPTGACLPNLMLQNLVDLLTPEEIDTVIGYLLTLDGTVQ